MKAESGDLRGDWGLYTPNHMSKKYKTYTKRRISPRSIICTKLEHLYPPSYEDMDTFPILVGDGASGNKKNVGAPYVSDTTRDTHMSV